MKPKLARITGGPDFTRVSKRFLAALLVLVVGSVVLTSESSAKTQVVKDGKDPPRSYRGYVPNLKKVVVTQTKTAGCGL